MIQLLSPRTVIVILSGVVLSGSFGLNWLVDIANQNPQSPAEHWRSVGLITSGIVGLCFWSPFWRLMWRTPVLGRYLERKFAPDLNGFWLVKIQSNFPTLKALTEDAASKRAADPKKSLEPSTHVFVGCLRQGWLDSGLELYGHDESVLDTSDTVLFEFRKSDVKHKCSIFWIYKQKNKTVGALDVGVFEGSAMMSIDHSGQISGTTWNNRNWMKGMNTAGPITMTKIESSPLFGELSPEKCAERAKALLAPHNARHDRPSEPKPSA
ncbi:hypothetical protein [Hyphomonas sp.]|uniref:hypothetical protein n=1 Tax=Hyphomonas sp. TaxID=87 RepID=UPI0025BD771D|nr:hypothetical protein [Hyphomonas sp.]